MFGNKEKEEDDVMKRLILSGMVAAMCLLVHGGCATAGMSKMHRTIYDYTKTSLEMEGHKDVQFVRIVDVFNNTEGKPIQHLVVKCDGKERMTKIVYTKLPDGRCRIDSVLPHSSGKKPVTLTMHTN